MIFDCLDDVNKADTRTQRPPVSYDWLSIRTIPAVQLNTATTAPQNSDVTLHRRLTVILITTQVSVTQELHISVKASTQLTYYVTSRSSSDIRVDPYLDTPLHALH